MEWWMAFVLLYLYAGFLVLHYEKRGKKTYYDPIALKLLMFFVCVFGWPLLPLFWAVEGGN